MRHPTVHRRMVICGTDSPNMLVFEMKNDGALLEQQIFENSENQHRQKPGPQGISVQWIALHPSGLHAYALTCFWTRAKGEAVTYAIDQQSGKLSRIGAPCCTGGHQPCRAAFTPGERPSWLAVVHCLDAVVSVLDCRNGELAPKPISQVRLPGARTFRNRSAQGGPFPLGLSFAPSSAYLAICDAGQELVHVFAFDDENGILKEVPVQVVTCNAIAPAPGFWQRQILRRMGARPCHIAFHPILDMVYVLTQCGNAVTWLPFNSSTGALELPSGSSSSTSSAAEVATCRHTKGCCLPAVNRASELHVSADGRFLYVSNCGFGRGSEDSVSVFGLDPATGAASWIQSAVARGHPRHFTTLQSSSALVVALHKAKSLARFMVDRSSGQLVLCSQRIVDYPVTCVAVCELLC